MNNGYDTTTNGHAGDGEKDHGLFELGHLRLYGCEKKSENIYTIKSTKDFAIEYILEQDPKDLPNKPNNELRVDYDEDTSVDNTSIQGKEIGRGAYEIKIIRKNGTTDEPIVATDFLTNKGEGAVISMLKNVENPSEIQKIEITIVYQLYFYASWFDHHHTNWRSDYTFYFNGATPEDFAE